MIAVKKYIFYWCTLILSVFSLAGYLMVGNFIFEMRPTGETFDVYEGTLSLTPYIYVDPWTGVLGVAIQAVGVFLFCVCFGILAGYCKKKLSHATKYLSVTLFAVCYILSCTYLFVNNFAILNFGDVHAVKEIWANAVNFLVCVSAAIFGFCAMYYFKNKDNHLIYK